MLFHLKWRIEQNCRIYLFLSLFLCFYLQAVLPWRNNLTIGTDLWTRSKVIFHWSLYTRISHPCITPQSSVLHYNDISRKRFTFTIYLIHEDKTVIKCIIVIWPDCTKSIWTGFRPIRLSFTKYAWLGFYIRASV